mmetsp:Transcript_53341/g.159164  ORF Transcript_53341/g.159164 Transcript_53341/m.159164 type:complete len:393 (+) Transcript_53341:580-1758(+)
MHGGKLHVEGLLESLLVGRVDPAEALGLQREEAVEHTLHRATVYQHSADLFLLTLRYVQLEDLVDALLKVHGGHDHQVYRPAEVDKILLSEVENLLCGLLVSLLLTLLLLGVVAAATAVVVALQAQNLVADLLPLGLVCRKLLRILRLEDVQGLLPLQSLIQQVYFMRDLVLLLHQVQILQNRGVVGKLLPADIEEALNDILHAPIYDTLMQDVLEALEDGLASSRRHLLQGQAALLDETHADLDGVVCDSLEEKRRNVQGKQLADDLLVDQVGHELDGGRGHDLVIPLVGAAELQDDPADDQVPDLRELGVDDGHETCKHVRESRRGHLSSDHRPRKEATPTDEVLLEELLHQVLDVRHVHLVHKAIDTLSECFPCLPLVLWACLVLDLLL